MADYFDFTTPKRVADRIAMLRRPLQITVKNTLPLYVRSQGTTYRADPVGIMPIEGPYEYRLTPAFHFEWDAIT